MADYFFISIKNGDHFFPWGHRPSLRKKEKLRLPIFQQYCCWLYSFSPSLQLELLSSEPNTLLDICIPTNSSPPVRKTDQSDGNEGISDFRRTSSSHRSAPLLQFSILRVQNWINSWRPIFCPFKRNNYLHEE